LRFSEVAGHKELKQRLIQSVTEERVPHAQLFHGSQGTGSLALALAYATYLSCTDRLLDDSCGTCSSCRKYDKLVHPDLHFVFPVFITKSVTSNPVSDDFIEEWRTALKDNPYMSLQQWYAHMGLENKQGIINKSESKAILKKLNMKAFESDHKIMIIWMPEKMNTAASNKLLKMIEEPPSMTVFLLVAENTGQILPTVLSRMQMINVPRLNDQDLLETLKKSYAQDEERLKNAVHLAEGNYNYAVEILGKSEEMEYFLELFIRIMRLSYSRKFQEIFDWVEEVSGLGRERQKSFMNYAIRMIRENYLLNLKQEKLVHLSSPETDFSGNARIVFMDFALTLVKLIR